MSVKSKPSSQVTHFTTGPAAPTAANSAPAPYEGPGIAGFGRLKAAGATGPTSKVTARGFNAPDDSPDRCCNMPGGPSNAGPSGTKGGTSSPSTGPGPTGLGLAGSKYPPIG